MAWTEPTTDLQKRNFSKLAPLRKLFGWLVWALLAIWAIVDLKGFLQLFTNNLSGVGSLSDYQLPITLGILAVLHITLYTTCKTYWFCKLDDKFAETPEEKASAAKTEASLVIPIIVTAIMLFASQRGSHAIFQGMVPVATIETTDATDAAKLAKRTEEKKALDADLATLETLYADRERTSKKPHLDAIARHRRSIANLKWDEKARRSTLLGLIRSEEKAMSDATTKILKQKDTEQQAAMDRYTAAVAMIDSSHKAAVIRIEADNRLEETAEKVGTAEAHWYSWIVSPLLAALFWFTIYQWVKISLQCGIRPRYAFSEFEKSGGPASWVWVAITDAFKRQAFRFSAWLHALLSTGTKELVLMDGQVTFKAPDEAKPSDPTPPQGSGSGPDNIRPIRPAFKLRKSADSGGKSAINNSSANPVITGSPTHYNLTVISDAQKRIMDIIITIRPEFSNYNNPQHRKTTVLKRLAGKFLAIDGIVEKYTPELIGEATMNAIEHERNKYLALPGVKEAAA